MEVETGEKLEYLGGVGNMQQCEVLSGKNEKKVTM